MLKAFLSTIGAGAIDEEAEQRMHLEEGKMPDKSNVIIPSPVAEVSPERENGKKDAPVAPAAPPSVKYSTAKKSTIKANNAPQFQLHLPTPEKLIAKFVGSPADSKRSSARKGRGKSPGKSPGKLHPFGLLSKHKPPMASLLGHVKSSKAAGTPGGGADYVPCSPAATGRSSVVFSPDADSEADINAEADAELWPLVESKTPGGPKSNLRRLLAKSPFLRSALNKTPSHKTPAAKLKSARPPLSLSLCPASVCPSVSCRRACRSARVSARASTRVRARMCMLRMARACQLVHISSGSTCAALSALP